MSSLVEIRSPEILGVPGAGGGNSELLTVVRAAGLMERDLGYYARRIAVDCLLLVGGWAAFVLVGQSWWQILVALELGVAFTHIGFLGHDAGHRQVFRSRRGNDLLGYFAANLAIGFSFGWWVDKHRRHHINPNHKGLDPDIDNKVVAFYPKPAGEHTALSRLVARAPVLAVAVGIPFQAFTLHVRSVQFLLKGRSRQPVVEWVTLGAHFALYLGLLVAVLDPARAVVFLLIQQGLFGTYFALVVAPNHKGMPIVEGNRRSDFVWRQVVTARNVDGGPLVDYMFGGLNHQIEHHLFPSMPRRALRRARGPVREYCRTHALPYAHASVLGSYRQSFGYLREVARAVPAAGAGT